MNQQDFLMHAECIQIDSGYSFKPIDQLDTSESDSFDNEPVSPTAIFRDAGEGHYHHQDNSNNDRDPMSISPLQLTLANPIIEQRGSAHSDIDIDVDGDGDCDAFQASGGGTRVISPFPFLHATPRELEERQELRGEAMTWSMPTGEIIDDSTTQEHQHESRRRIDYSLFFQSGANVNVNATVNAGGAGMDCDDFSISSLEAESIEDDLWCFEKISGDPAAFWEEGMDQGVAGPARVRIPSQDSSSSNGPVRPIVSVGKVPRRRPIQPTTP
jgi:hypothetical protein